MDPNMFFPQRGGDVKSAKAVCATCPVIDQCLASHLHEEIGIWGGTTEQERRTLRAELRAVGRYNRKKGRPPTHLYNTHQRCRCHECIGSERKR